MIRALSSVGETAASRAEQWRRVLAGMFDGTLDHGSRTPVAGTPSWVTLEVAHGGFATGRLMAAGPLEAHELEKLHHIQRPPSTKTRAALNHHFLGDAGREELLALLSSGCYRVTVPEEAALLVTAWLIQSGDTARAEAVLAEISPYLDRLRFYPVPSDRPARSGDGVFVRPASEVITSLRGVRPKPAIQTMNEAIQVWTPLYDRAVELLLDTVEGETPHLRTSESGELIRRADGSPIVEGGWPCRRYPDDWADRAWALLEEYKRERMRYRLCGKPERAKENFARLRGYLRRCARDPRGLTGRDVGMIRKILASFVTSHGAPGSERLARTRAAQARNASLPSRHELAQTLADRIAKHGNEDGIPDLDACLGPLTAGEAAEIGADPGAPIPASLAEKAAHCFEAPIETLVARRIVRSSETIARLLPALSAAVRANAIEPSELRGVYEASYRAFRQRRSLLLLNLESQVRFEELPWIAALVQVAGTQDDSRRDARTALVRAVRLVLESFPQTILPNKLVRELRSLATAAGERIPLVDELATDIFMGDFSASYLRAAQAAAPVVAGTLYERYYGLPLDRLLTLNDVEKRWYDTPTSPGFAALCRELAGAANRRRSGSVAWNGTIIEQAQILTTHNVAPLLDRLDLADELRPEFPDLARRCFEWICRRQQFAIGDWQAQMQSVKNSAYAWRHMILYLALADAQEPQRFLEWAELHLSRQREDFQVRFTPVMAGLRAIVAGGSFDHNGCDPVTGGRRFLGWTIGRHWLLPERP